MTNTKKMVFISLLIAQALALNIIERSIPVPFIAPGAKLGLANIITIVSLYIFGFKDTLMVVLIRILLVSMFGGSLSSFLYSFSGGILSLISMYFIKKIGRENISIIGVSVVGAAFHNIGQVIVASLVVENIKMFLYLPILLAVSLGTGVFVGITSKYLLSFLNKINISN
ncbi:heptaprenyl diphosphate synthase component I [Clostridium acetireducens DSM 10703]|jgi:heptaprenyl diphosphate synthase|uniref:Heptaprenyl diphosphate synthase component I n=1 Tax=Clostridium acetireducens DSM 10703 TaxID=1121290 RepID=A0A1E8EY17_9CLOT|nr:Gx transporter family protein [Clostridium acetireducens]OFI05823.1 heptaprenyl diphosphate synthase component I [Clostridium acetireducens DSM 10703]